MNNRNFRKAKKTSLRVEILERRDFLSVVVFNGGLDCEPSVKTIDSSYYEETEIPASLLNQSVISVEEVSTTQLATSVQCVESSYTEQRSLNLDNSERFYSVLAKDVFYRLKEKADSRAVALASIVSEWLNPPDETFSGEETFLDSDELTDSILTSDHVLTYRLRGAASFNNQNDSWGNEALATMMTSNFDSESSVGNSDGVSTSGGSTSGGGSGGDGSFLYADISGGCVNTFSGGGLSFPTDHVVAEGGTFILITATTVDASVTVSIDGVESSDYLVNEISGTLTFSTLSDEYYEGDEVMTITVTAVSSEGTEQKVITVTIVDSPEFVSILDIKQDVAPNAVTNDMSEFFFDTSMLYKVTDIYDINVLHAHDIILQWAPTSVPDWSNIGNNIAIDAANEKIIYVPYDDNSVGHGQYIGGIVASYIDSENFSDTLNLSITWADIEKAKASVRNCRSETFDLSYCIGSNTCERFALDLEKALNSLMETDTNFKLAISAVNVVYFSIESSNPFTTGHAAVEVTYRNGATIYYDNGGLLDGVWEYTAEQFPENARLDNGD